MRYAFLPLRGRCGGKGGWTQWVNNHIQPENVPFQVESVAIYGFMVTFKGFQQF